MSTAASLTLVGSVSFPASDTLALVVLRRTDCSRLSFVSSFVCSARSVRICSVSASCSAISASMLVMRVPSTSKSRLRCLRLSDPASADSSVVSSSPERLVSLWSLLCRALASSSLPQSCAFSPVELVDHSLDTWISFSRSRILSPSEDNLSSSFLISTGSCISKHLFDRVAE